MKKHNPQETMPDEDTEVLASWGKGLGYVVVYYDGCNWYEAWSDFLIVEFPEYWVDLDDIEDSLK